MLADPAEEPRAEDPQAGARRLASAAAAGLGPALAWAGHVLESVRDTRRSSASRITA